MNPPRTNPIITGDVYDLDLLRELSDPADEYEGKNPPFGGGKLYNSSQVSAMLTNFAGRMIVKYRRDWDKAKVGPERP